MKRFLLALALLLAPSLASAQCNGVFPNNTVCGNITGTANVPGPTSPASFLGSAGGTNGQIQYNNGGALGGFTMSGDCTTNTSSGVITCGPPSTGIVPTARGGTGISNATNAANEVLASNGANGNFVHTAITSVLNTVCGLSPNTCGTIFGYLNASWYLAGTTCDGVTDQYANLQAFLTQIAANGAAGTGPTTGYFPPGNCFVTNTLTITTNSNAQAVNYHYVGYGTTISPNPASSLIGLNIVRGTFLTHGDESRTITVEGLSVNARNNANIVWCFQVGDTRVYLLRMNCMAGDDGVTHAQGNFACFYWKQITDTDPNTGAFYGKLFQSTCKGNGVGVSAVPVALRVDGSGGNGLVVAENAFAQGVYGIRLLNPCATVNTNCAYHPNNVVIRDNNIEGFNTCVEYRTSVPTLSKIIGGVVEGNTFELCSAVDIDISTFTQQSNPNQAVAFGPNTGIGTITPISNPNAIQVILPNAKQWP